MNTPSLFNNQEIIKFKDNNILPKDGEVLWFPNFFNEADSDKLGRRCSRASRTIKQG